MNASDHRDGAEAGASPSPGNPAKRIYVTRSFLPPKEEFLRRVDQVWESGQLTNQGPLLKEFESNVAAYLNVPGLHVVANGTLALQLALSALDVRDGEVITTPFSYVATVSAILWERCHPVFVDIEAKTLCIDPAQIEAAITEHTKAILGVHVFGRPCDIQALEDISRRRGIPVIYDGAHAFGVRHQGDALLAYGDISTCSFHATKLFHMVEGGAVVARDPMVDARLELVKRFGHNYDDHICLGINAKASEFHAAMGLCNLPYLDKVIAGRRAVSELYDELLSESLRPADYDPRTERNYAYYPVILRSAGDVADLLSLMAAQDIYPRRYFFPALNTLPYLTERVECPIAEDIASRIVCLPLYPELDPADVRRIVDLVRMVAPG